MTVLFVALLSLACSKKGYSPYSDENAIAFTSACEDGFKPLKGSKATIVSGNTSFAAGDAVGIYAMYHKDAAVAGEDFMGNRQLTAANSATGLVWSYSPLSYWPNNSGDKLSFFAYSPYNTSPLAAGGGLSLPVDGITDVMHAYQAQTDKATSNGKVSFVFNHLLMRVGMKFVKTADADDEDFHVVKVVAEDFCDKVIVSEPYKNLAASDLAYPAGPFATTATVMVGASYVPASSANAASAPLFGNYFFLPARPDSAENSGNGAGEYATPDDVAASTTAATVSFEVTIQSKVTGNLRVWEKSVALPAVAPGKSYTLTFHLGNSFEVTVDAVTAESWGNVDFSTWQ